GAVAVGALAEAVAFAGVDRGHHQRVHQGVERGVHAVEQLLHRRLRLGAVGDAPRTGQGVDGQFAPVAERMVAFGAEQQRVVEGVPAGGVVATEGQRAQLVVGNGRARPVVLLALVELFVREGRQCGYTAGWHAPDCSPCTGAAASLSARRGILDGIATYLWSCVFLRSHYGFRRANVQPMCSDITRLRGLEPAATEQEIYASALQYVRKVGGVSGLSTTTKAAV